MKFYVMIVYAMSVLLTADWLEAVSSRQAFISFRTASSALRSNHRRGNDDIKVNTITAKVNNHTTSVSSDIYDWRLALAGGLAGGLSNAIIYPIDTVKTMMQTDRNLRKFPQVLKKLRTTGYSRLYAGVTPAVVGSIPSSMLYFGSYEFMKRWLAIHMPASVSHFTPIYRPSIHFIAAACGNLVSSIVFVPKEVIKQQLQAYRTGSLPWNTARAVSKINSWTICKIIYAESGIKGFFPSYKATLARNIPSAMIRFAIFEELKLLVQRHMSDSQERLGILIAGIVASGFSSAITTPFDVIKTRIATGMLPPGTPIVKSIMYIAQREGLSSLYAGVYARVLWSSVFGGIGLTCFEECKRALRVHDVALVASIEDQTAKKSQID